MYIFKKNTIMAGNTMNGGNLTSHKYLELVSVGERGCKINYSIDVLISEDFLKKGC